MVTKLSGIRIAIHVSTERRELRALEDRVRGVAHDLAADVGYEDEVVQALYAALGEPAPAPVAVLRRVG